MVADGFPLQEIALWERTQHIQFPKAHNDTGDTPRLAGAISAAAQQYNGIVFLDADNWFEPGHIESLIQAHVESQAPVVTCARTLRRPDTGEVLSICRESNGIQFNDTNCYLFTEKVFYLLAAWGLRSNQAANEVGAIGDRIVWNSIVNSQVKRAHVSIPTVNYETAYAVHYKALGLQIPDFAKIIIRSNEEQRSKIISYSEYQLFVAQGLAKPI